MRNGLDTNIGEIGIKLSGEKAENRYQSTLHKN